MSSSSSSSSTTMNTKAATGGTATNLWIPFDPSSPLLVAKGVLATGTLGAITGASIGVVRSQNPFALSINMTINLSIAGLTFFGIREYLVSPILLSTQITSSHARRLSQLQQNATSSASTSEKAKVKLPDLSINAEDEQPTSLNEVRMDRIIDSAMAGALTGGILSSAFRGRATFFRAAITSSLIASTLQLSINQLRVIRLQLLAKRAETIASSSSTPPSTSPSVDIAIERTNSPIQASFDDPLKFPSSQDNKETISFPERIMSGLTSFLPVRKLSDEQYLDALVKKRQDVDKRLGEIDEEEQRMWDWAQSQSQSKV